MHRDIKTANVLLDSSETHAKVTDFGISTTFGKDGGDYTAETGTYRFMAPEVIVHKPYDNRCDVYAAAATSALGGSAKSRRSCLTRRRRCFGFHEVRSTPGAAYTYGGGHFAHRYSFAMLLWEVLHCEVPFSNYAPLQAAFAVAMEGQRPPIHLRPELEMCARNHTPHSRSLT
jgi:serine/threonine protein kinase